MKKISLLVLLFPFSIANAFELKGSFDTSLNSNSVNPAYDRTISQDFSLSLYTMINENRLLLESSVSKEYSGEGEWTLSDPSLSFTSPLYKNEFLSINLTESSLIGISKESRKNTTLNTSLKISPSVTLTSKFFNLEGFKLTYTPSLRKNLHSEKVSASGKSNFSWVAANKLTAFYQINEKFYLNGYINYQRGFTYSSNSKDRIDHSEALGMILSESLSTEIGHSYGANPLTPDGKDFRVNFYDQRFSNVYISFSYGF